MIAIVDYGAGNLHSVKNALDFIGAKSFVTSDAQEIKSACGVILPGVGAFGDAMNSMRQNNLHIVIKDIAKSGRPFLGICIGLQLLFESSQESPGVAVLGVLNGTINKIPDNLGLKVPHIGWNSVKIHQKTGIFKGIEENSYLYFVHSYYLKANNDLDVTATTHYGVEIDAAVQSGNTYAVQFHPEKSGDNGILILKNFVQLAREG
ncbi:MAG: imidazole glycerol phosphate synthase subunit HisH [Oscillospiraceae bacterium]|jgi:glutamine amidotransferase|nr:imidazole glycerol phosphate synthase subunit HisH [Oscillospiraceae bacterium]